MSNKFTYHSKQEIREILIRELDEASGNVKSVPALAENLFAVDLTVYSRNNTFDSILYNAFATSELDERISLHPEQMRVIQTIQQEDALIISAPTSFGKTFCVFEYIVRAKPQNIVLVVPTLALIEEYKNKILSQFSRHFSQYVLYTHIDEDSEYNFGLKNIFILTHDRIVNENSYKKIERIDFLVIDEVYKLKKDPTNDRVLILNMAYYYLAQKAKKYVLLAPFIKEILDRDKLFKNPKMLTTEYSPVVNDVHVEEITDSNDKLPTVLKLLQNNCFQQKTLIFFPTVTGLNKFIQHIVSNEHDNKHMTNKTPLTDDCIEFIKWVAGEIHEDWSLIKALEHGYLVHHGQIPAGIKNFQLDLFKDPDQFDKLLCTSTLLEGVNTVAKNIIITAPSRFTEKPKFGEEFSAFDFYNLVGRTGRLYQHRIGHTYYIKLPTDLDYDKNDAATSIRFELTDETSVDIDIMLSESKDEEFNRFLERSHMTYAQYRENIAGKLLFHNVVALYDKFKEECWKLENELRKLYEQPRTGRYTLITCLEKIIDCHDTRYQKYYAALINQLLHRKRLKIRDVVISAMDNYSRYTIDKIISDVISLKTNYIEHTFYTKVKIIRFFLTLDNINHRYLQELDKRILEPIELLYFASSKQKKMLADFGVYDRDIDSVISIIKDDFQDAFELKQRLQANQHALRKTSFITQYMIKKL